MNSFHFEYEIFEQMEWARKAPEDGEGIKKGDKTFNLKRERGFPGSLVNKIHISRSAFRPNIRMVQVANQFVANLEGASVIVWLPQVGQSARFDPLSLVESATRSI